MINLRFILSDGSTHMVYDVHPRSQETNGVPVPPSAVSVEVWLGTIAGEHLIITGEDNEPG